MIPLKSQFFIFRRHDQSVLPGVDNENRSYSSAKLEVFSKVLVSDQKTPSSHSHLLHSAAEGPSSPYGAQKSAGSGYGFAKRVGQKV